MARRSPLDHRAAHRAALGRRAFLGALAAGAGALFARPARAFDQANGFDPRPLLVGDAKWEGLRTTAPAQWSRELRERTSAATRWSPAPVRADEEALLGEPFVWWVGDGPVAPLTGTELARLRRFFAQGGVILVDDAAPETGTFLQGAKRELARVLPDAAPVPVGPEHVIFRSFYLLSRAVGRVEGPPKLEAIIRGGNVQVVFSSHDLAGALAQSPAGMWSIPVTPGGEEQREKAVRLAVNIAMYVLCSNYKDDQVHAPWIMRRRLGEPR